MMTRTERLDRAVRGVLGPILQDYATGRIDGEELDRWVERSANAIREQFHAMGAVVAVEHCVDCNRPLGPNRPVVRVAGVPYCPAHAVAHKPDMPEWSA